MQGKFIISLDFELIWGIFDIVDYKAKKQYLRQTREVIPEILKLFLEYEIHATWATVGMLFNENWEEWEGNIPSEIPNYKNKSLSAYRFGENIKSKTTEEFCFAPDLIKLIFETTGQEVATHTYSHYYCMAEGQTARNFDQDLAKAGFMAKKMKMDLKSLIFPRNQINPEYLHICKEHGIENVRSNPSSWYWKNNLSEAFTTKISRSGDAYLPLGHKTYPPGDLIKKEGLPLEQKSSRFLRPVEGNNVMRKLKLNRIKREITRAAKNNEVYHLWWHPHNFGEQPEKSLSDLQVILKHFKHCNEKYNFQSATMEKLGQLV